MANGSLWLRCRRAIGAEFGGYPYSEGFVHSDGKKNYTYGYAEVRARFATGTGVWPAFWTLSQGWPPEFDIAEYFGSDDRMHMGLAYGTSWQDVQWNSSNFYNEGFGDWHTYGLEWGPGYAIWYRDGTPRKHVYASYVPTSAMYLILNSGMRTDANYTAPYQNLTEIDYCRVFSPPAAAVNDNSTGTGLNQFEYVGTWGYYNAQAGAFFNDNHWSGNVNDSCLLRFTGARVDVYAALAANHGIGAFSVDGGTEFPVDFYAAARSDKVLVWSSPSLSYGTHTLRLRVTGSKNTASTGTAVPLDRVDVWSSSARLSGSVIGTPGSWGNSGNTITNVFDANLGTFFDAPAATGGWVGLSFDGPGRRISTVRYCPRGGFPDRMVGGRFQSANKFDFTDSVDLAAVTTVPPLDRFTDLPVAHSGGFRYVRFLSGTNGYCNVAELEFLGGTASLPAVPAFICAVGMHTQVSLAWPTSFGAASYRVSRASSSGGPYAALADYLTSTNYTDAALVNGNTWYYVVAARNSAGLSANSNEASATPQAPSVGVNFDRGASEVTFSWPSWASAFRLYSTTNIGSSTRWVPLTNAPVSSNGLMYLRLTASTDPVRFFRLGSP